MSGEMFDLLQRTGASGTEKQIALQCAPLLTGIKMSSLLNIREEQKKEVFRLFDRTPVSGRILYESAGRTLLFLYRKERLLAYLERGDVRRLMDSFGYGGLKLEKMLRLLSIRYQEHMSGLGKFPHEIGLLLGYPPGDVSGFIENNGQNFLYSGYWKVYGDEAEAQSLFQKFDRCREAYRRMFRRGCSLEQLTVAAGARQQGL